jgi:hypothetical protein
MSAQLTWFAIVIPASLTGYALDAYPEERLKYRRRRRGVRVLGEFATREEAMARVEMFLKKRVALRRLKALSRERF